MFSVFILLFLWYQSAGLFDNPRIKGAFSSDSPNGIAAYFTGNVVLKELNTDSRKYGWQSQTLQAYSTSVRILSI